MNQLPEQSFCRRIGLLLVVASLLAAASFAGEYRPAAAAPAGWSAPVNIGHTTYGSYQPSIVMDSQGYSHAVWWGNAEVETERVIWYANNRSGTWSAPRSISPVTECRYPKIAITPSDELHVVYVDWASSQIIHTFSTNYGTSWSPRQNISLSPLKASEPDVTADAEGNVHAVWIDQRWAGAPLYQVTYAKRTAGTWGAPVRVQSTIGFNKAPRAVTTGTGANLRVHIAFYGKSSDTDPNYKYEVYYVRGTGSSWEAVKNLSSSPDLASYSPSIATDEGSALYVVWDETPSGSYHDIYMKYSTDNGSNWSAARTIVVNPSLSRYPSAAYGQDLLHIGFDDDVTGGGDIFYSTYNPANGQVSTPLNLSETGGASSEVDVAVNICRVGAAWQDRVIVGNPLDIYYATTPDTPPGPCPGIAPEGTVEIIAQDPVGSRAYTRLLTVGLNFQATAAPGFVVQWMRYANQSDFQDHPDWVPYSTSVPSWNLAIGQNCEAKQVFAQFRDNGNPPRDSEVTSAQIFYDNYLSAAMTLNGGAAYTNRTMVMVNSQDTDAAAGCSGLAAMALWEAGFTQTVWISYLPSLYFSLAPEGPVTRTVYVTYRDRANNQGTRSDSILLDTIPPTGTPPILNNGQPTTHLVVSASGLQGYDDSGIASVWMANTPDGPWMALTYCASPPCTYNWNLGYGGPPVQYPDLHHVYVQYEDRSGYGSFPGNFSAVYSGTIQVNGISNVYLPLLRKSLFGRAAAPGRSGEVALFLASGPGREGHPEEVALYLVAWREQRTWLEGDLRMVLPAGLRVVRAWSAYGRLLQVGEHEVVSRERASSRLAPWLLVLARVEGEGEVHQVDGDMAWPGGVVAAPALVVGTR